MYDVYAFRAGNVHSGDFPVKASGCLRLGASLLAAYRKGILVGAGNIILRGDDFRRLRHGIHPIELLHAGVDETPSHRRIFELGGARIGGTRCVGDGIETAAAQTIEGYTRNRLRQAGKQ